MSEPAMPEPVRLAKRVAELAGCSRREADQYIQGGWVTVDGEVVDAPQHPITTQRVEIDPEADLSDAEPVLDEDPARPASADRR